MASNWLTILNNEITACRLCPRLVEYREKIRREKRRAYIDQEYWAKPVPGFGEPNAKVLILGLGPGAHGALEVPRFVVAGPGGRRAGWHSFCLLAVRCDGARLYARSRLLTPRPGDPAQLRRATRELLRQRGTVQERTG